MTAGLSIYAFGIGLANAGLVRLTLFASDMRRQIFCGDGNVGKC